MSERPAHHGPDGRFRIPWPLEVPDQTRNGGVLRWQRERLSTPRPPNPRPEQLPPGTPDVAHPRAAADDVRITWIGHATFLIQLGGLNLLTDPHFSRRASPLRWMGPSRFVPPAIALDALPPIDAVLLSHDHYDHLDAPTVRRLHRAYGDELAWIAPLGHAAWLAGMGIRANVHDVDWWDTVELRGAAGPVTVTCAPAQHWTRRTMREFNNRLWGSFAIRGGNRCLYFGGDSGYFRGYEEIGARLGPFDAVMMPIGAYDPRWFMAPAHMNPEEAVRAYREMGGRGAFIPMHWGTFRLTDEDPLEPPVRLRKAWADEHLPGDDLHVLRHGDTVRLAHGPRAPSK
ncbi:MAG TPA: MBL fold metallo-hydrolase [Longimicrobium sp.]|jgi:L-ascorbate metabolism protein UlaG (beta-lactamase superfamily)|uniref:MBL fold metallo-hydrolase n=1 Tax=Longimicrobium sp. TaxID=2029185 RepID=UPI002ED9CA69